MLGYVALPGRHRAAVSLDPVCHRSTSFHLYEFLRHRPRFRRVARAAAHTPQGYCIGLLASRPAKKSRRTLTCTVTRNSVIPIPRVHNPESRTIEGSRPSAFTL